MKLNTMVILFAVGNSTRFLNLALRFIKGRGINFGIQNNTAIILFTPPEQFCKG
jgi:hypothetical protein